MDSYQLKEYIIENNKVEFILQELSCQNIKYHSSSSGYWTCGNPPPSDNPQAITIYNNEYLNVVNYTKEMGDKTDIFSLIEFINKCNFFEAMLWCCNVLGLDYYHEPTLELPESLRITKMLMKMKSNDEEEDDTPIRVLNESILGYYKTPCVNDMFLRDGINYKTQLDFLIGFDNETNRITIPIFDEINSLVSIKGRIFQEVLSESEKEFKYIYLYKCPRNKILFGLNKTHNYIKESGKVWVTESEKGTLQLWSHGVRNCVGIGGKRIGKRQVEMLSRLGAEIIFSFDKDVMLEELEKKAKMFVEGISIYAIIDEDNILNDKQSPMDDFEKWKILSKNNVYKIK